MKNPVVQKNGFQYTRKQEAEIEEFINLIQDSNEELEIKEGAGTTYATTISQKKIR